MLMFILGTFAGSLISVLFMALCNSSGNAENKIEELMKERKNKDESDDEF